MNMKDMTPQEAAEHSRKTREGMERARAAGKQIGSAPYPIWRTDRFHALAHEVEKKNITLSAASKALGVSAYAFRKHYVENGYKPTRGTYSRRLSRERRMELAGLLRLHKTPQECAETMGVPYSLVRNELMRVLKGAKK